MRRIVSVIAFATIGSFGTATAQVSNLSPTDGGGSWQVKCTVIAVDAPPIGPCSGVYSNAVRVTATPGGWASVPVVGPGGDAYYVGPLASASIWVSSPNENPHYEYTYKTTFVMNNVSQLFASLFLDVFRIDNYWGGWSLNGSVFSTGGITPGPLAANGANWMTPFQLALVPGSGFVEGTNTLELRLQGNGRTDAILAQGTYTANPEPATMVLMATGLAGLALVQRKRRRV